MKLQFAKIQSNETIDYALELNEPLVINKASIVSIKAAAGTIDLAKADDVYIINYHIKANLTVLSSVSNEPFDYEETIEEEIYYTDKSEFKSNDVFFINKDYIDLDEEVFSLIITSLPIQLHKPGEDYPKGENFRVISEEDLEKEMEEESDSPFAKLLDLDLED